MMLALCAGGALSFESALMLGKACGQIYDEVSGPKRLAEAVMMFFFVLNLPCQLFLACAPHGCDSTGDVVFKVAHTCMNLDGELLNRARAAKGGSTNTAVKVP